MAAQMARTFLDDPVTSHIFRNEARREAGLRAYFRTQMKADYLAFGGCYTTDDHAGSAILGSGRESPCRPGFAGILHHGCRPAPTVGRQPAHGRLRLVVAWDWPRVDNTGANRCPT